MTLGVTRGDVSSGKGNSREDRDFEGKPQDAVDWVWNSQKKRHKWLECFEPERPPT